MKYRDSASVDRIKEVLNYDPLTGIIVWKKATAKYDRTGMEASTSPTQNGYRSISLDKKDHMAQRIAWIIMTGDVPSGRVRFKDGNPTNLKWANLVLAKAITGYDTSTPEGRSGYQKAYRASNPKREKERALQDSFGITLREYEDMLIAQKGCCAICNQRETAKRKGKDVALCVDHCHKTGGVRGLLCTACNQGLGQFKDNQVSLSSAISYLAKHKEKKTATNVVQFAKP